jgi:hypothetical protein
VSVELTSRGRARWTRAVASSREHRRRTGLATVYAIVLDGTIVATPFANDLRLEKRTLVLTGFTKAGARLVVRKLA